MDKNWVLTTNNWEEIEILGYQEFICDKQWDLIIHDHDEVNKSLILI